MAESSMADLDVVESASSSAGPSEQQEEEEKEFLPGFPTFEDYSKALIKQVMQVTKSVNGLPDEGDDYDYYSSFPGYKTFCEKMGSRINRSISKVFRHQQLPCYWPTSEGGSEGGSGGVGVDERFETLVEANDILLERVTMLLDEAAGVKKNEQPILPPKVQQGRAEVASWNNKRDAVRGQMDSYRFIHARNVPRPQLKFKDQVDNGNTPFIPLIRHKPHAMQPLPEIFQKLQNPTTLTALIDNTREWSSSEKRFSHPYEYELNHLTYTEDQLLLKEPQLPGSLEDTPLTFVTSLEELEALKQELMTVKEFAIDLEHHSYRSFLGFVCLVQISTRNHDYIVDPLELRHHMHILLEVFADPSIVKVFHGADMDIQWLQRDFGLYVVNMFDTGQASRVLNLPKFSLAFLLQYCCNVQADKQFQLADWRIRPLPSELINYAREDTHYLLYIYDRMRNELVRRGNQNNNLLMSVLDRSRDVCLKRYEKPVFSEDNFLALYHRNRRRFNTQQLYCLKLLYSWRDHLARQEDESTGYVLPNHMLFQISEILPREAQGVLACCNPIPTLLRQQLQEVFMLVQKARDYNKQDELEHMKSQHSSSLMEGASDDTHLSPTEETDSAAAVVEEGLPWKPQVEGPPVDEAIPVMSVFSVKEPKVSRAMKEKLKKINESFPDLLEKFIPIRAMAPSEVLQLHMSLDTPTPNLPPAKPTSSLTATPTNVSTNEGDTWCYESNKTSPDSERRPPPEKKRRISVRDMEKRRSSVGNEGGEVARKHSGNSSNASTEDHSIDQRRKSDDKNIKPFQYEGTNFSDFTKDGTMAPVTPIEFPPSDRRKRPRPSGSSDGTSHPSDSRGKKKKQFTAPRSRVHQKSAEKSHTFSHGRGGSKRPSWPG